METTCTIKSVSTKAGNVVEVFESLAAVQAQYPGHHLWNYCGERGYTTIKSALIGINKTETGEADWLARRDSVSWVCNTPETKAIYFEPLNGRYYVCYPLDAGKRYPGQR